MFDHTAVHLYAAFAMCRIARLLPHSPFSLVAVGRCSDGVL